MMNLIDLSHYITLPFGYLIGLMLGFTYFVALRETTAVIVTQRNALLGLALTLGRIGFVVALFAITVLAAGGEALVAALAGLLCARMLMLRQQQREDL